ncbi:hypothetical protein [uncultured Aquimonas sp.]|uniref:hypothetical protein n=1 Tax=uncultured Aquimonas sp. TaxID=385483 RepID=UPI00086EB484|nr:hypothetical protein [uncultured Aquimonas sp.]ODU46709.1 MAG: hypothetical protein ABS96_08095 [Xanthomonadaceae bacterium SCN 69-123]
MNESQPAIGLDSFVCLFCAEPIESGPQDPCALHLTACIDRAERLWKDQTFFCHLRCLQSRAMIGPESFYIAEPDFATRGEIEAERQAYGDD